MTPPAKVTEEFREELNVVLTAALNDMDIFHEVDLAETMWLPLSTGEFQPVVWPMILHRHDQDCARA